MSALTFTLKSKPTFKLNCSRLTLNGLTGLSVAQISNLPFASSKNSSKVVDYFEVSGTDTENIIFKNSNNQLDFIGYKMVSGQITIEGDCGDFLGANMQGGSIICNGNAGDRIGDQMRRGLMLIDGNAGDYCGSRMLAGTIGVHGKVGKYAGFGMKRGTILLTEIPIFHATMQDCGSHNLPFLKILFNAIKPLKSKFSMLDSTRVQRYGGDIACNGNGEILIFKS